MKRYDKIKLKEIAKKEIKKSLKENPKQCSIDFKNMLNHLINEDSLIIDKIACGRLFISGYSCSFADNWFELVEDDNNGVDELIKDNYAFII